MVADAEPGSDVDPMQDAEAWQSLSRQEQSDILDDGLADLRGDRGDGEWRHLSDSDQEKTVRTIERGDDPEPTRELSETERAMQAALNETWTANLFEGEESIPTVPFECRPLSSSESDKLASAMQCLAQVEEAATSEEDIETLEVDNEHFDSPAEVEKWIIQFLADVTVDSAFDEERWRSGEGLRSGTRKDLLLAIFAKEQKELDNAVKFRTGE